MSLQTCSRPCSGERRAATCMSTWGAWHRARKLCWGSQLEAGRPTCWPGPHQPQVVSNCFHARRRPPAAWPSSTRRAPSRSDRAACGQSRRPSGPIAPGAATTCSAPRPWLTGAGGNFDRLMHNQQRTRPACPRFLMLACLWARPALSRLRRSTRIRPACAGPVSLLHAWFGCNRKRVLQDRAVAATSSGRQAWRLLGGTD